MFDPGTAVCPVWHADASAELGTQRSRGFDSRYLSVVPTKVSVIPAFTRFTSRLVAGLRELVGPSHGDPCMHNSVDFSHVG